MYSSTPDNGVMYSEECSSSSSMLVHRNLTTAVRRHEEVESSLLSFASEEDEDVQFDTSDTENNREVLMAGRHYPSIQEFASAIPNHLLLGSLLEHLCCVYESNPARSRALFKAIGQRLAAMNLLSPLAISDEFSTVRLQHNRAFTELLNAASSSLYPQGPGSNAHNPALRPKEGLFQAQTSRYLSEFEERSRLGKGSYGNVFKVLNKLDGQCYAVKKILIKQVSKEDCMKVLREVKVLSSLQHVNIVGYHTAWMEHVQPVTYPGSSLPALESPGQDGLGDSPDNSSTSSSIVFQSQSHAETDAALSVKGPASETQPSRAIVSTSEGQVVCPRTMRRIPDNYVPCVFLGQREPRNGPKCPAMGWDTSALLDEGSSRNSIELNKNSYIDKECQQWADKQTRRPSKEVQFQLMLYIQMQLCERSLKDWISERNTKKQISILGKCILCICPTAHVSTDVEQWAAILRRPRSRCAAKSLAQAPYDCVDTEHTLRLLKNILEGVEYIHSRGIMHRDLKPRNIFLHGHDCHVRIGDFGLACKDIIDDSKRTSSPGSDSTHTSGVGTFVYAAPEQLKGSKYDSQSDMYSIGVLAFELFQPFGTEMERVRTLGDLRDGKIPDQFCLKWPVLTKNIMKLTSKKPSVRPTARQLLESELFCKNDMVIHGLQRRVEEQQEEIMQLRMQISQLQSSKVTVTFSDSNS